MRETRRAGRPLSVWYFLVLAAASIVGAYGASTYASYYETDFLAYPCWFALALYWVARLGTALTTAGWAKIRQHAVRWLLPPLIILAMVEIVALKGPMWLRFSLSEPAMRSYASQVAAGAEPEPECRWLGLYYVCGADHVTGGELLISHDIGLMERMGFAWFPNLDPHDTPADESPDDEYFHVTGHWWGYKGWDGL